MEDPKWLKFMTVGLVLAALAVGYFLFTSRFSSSAVKTNTQISQVTSSASPTVAPKTTVLGQNTKASPAPTATATPAPTAASASAYNRIASRTQTNGSTVSTLPNTGFPAGLVATLTASIMISGLGLRKFPH